MLPDLDVRLQRHAAQLETMAPVIDLPEVETIAASIPARDLKVPVRISHRRAAIAVAILALGLIAAAIGLSLRSETVDPSPQVGKFLQMEIGPDGLPFLVYSDAQTGGTVFAKCADRFCADDTTFTPFNGFFPTVLMRDDSRPLIWIDGPDGSEVGPWILDCQNTSCSEYTQVDARRMPNQPAAISPSGRAAYLYPSADGLGTVIGVCSSAACTDGPTETVIAGGTVDRYDVQFDPSGAPLALFVDNRDGVFDLRLIRCSAPDCSSGYSDSMVASGDRLQDVAPFAVSIAEGDVPMIVYGRYEVQLLDCPDPTCANASPFPLGDGQNAWTLELVDGRDGQPLVVYNWSLSSREDTLKAASCHNGDCRVGSIATIHRGPTIGSMAATLDSDGYPVIAFRSEEGVIATTCADRACAEGALAVETWDHTEPVPATTLPPTTEPPMTTPPTTRVGTPPPPPAAGPAFEAGRWLKTAGYEAVFNCDWSPTNNPQLEECATPIPRASRTASQLAFPAMANLDGTLVVISESCSGFDDCAEPWTTAWISSDGIEWTPSLIAVTGWVEWLVQGDVGLVAVGEQCEAASGCRAAVWASPDGMTWTEAPYDSLPDCTGLEVTFQCITGVAAGAGHYLMYGHSADGGALWISSDGLSWSPIDPGLPDDHVAFAQSAWILRDRLVVLANECGPMTAQETQSLLWDEIRGHSFHAYATSIEWGHWASCTRTLWMSEGGNDWSRVGAPEVFASMAWWRDGVSRDDGAFIFGEVCEDEWTCWTQVWSTSDGLTWESRAFEGIVPEGATAITADAIVMAGVVFDELDTGEWRRFIWTSTDGLVWVPTEFDPESFPGSITAMAAYGNGVVVISDGFGDPQRTDLAGVWTWMPES